MFTLINSMLLAAKRFWGKFLNYTKKNFYVKQVVLLLAIFFSAIVITNAQERTLSYIIKRSDNPVGNMSVKEVKAGSKISLWLDLEIKTSFILSFKAKGIEEAVYDNGILTYSFVYQKLNNKEKVNKKTRFVHGSYVVNNKGSEDSFKIKPIYYNMVCLYTHEPLKNTQIYSDKFQKYLPIQKFSEHHYKVTFPNGDSNQYYYEAGICTKIEVANTFYSVVMELQK